jgi:3' terminal RNA ribose 2'-O-methyltransferase Hen1
VLLTLTTTHRPATDLGFLLHKNPARAQSFDTSQGRAHVFYPEATEERCTAALLLEVDPVALVRGAGERGQLTQYVNDRPYAASSLLAVALGRAFASARRGTSKERPELAATPIPLEVQVPALACSGGPRRAERFFAPLGWEVEAREVPLDEEHPEWGRSRYVDLRLRGTVRVADALNHLYVALPVLDDAKHYWVSTDEIDKLLRAGEGWLAEHPERDAIVARYLAHRRALATELLSRLSDVEEVVDEGVDRDEADRPVPLKEHRHEAVLTALRETGARRVLDLGCGPGALLPALMKEFAEVVGVEVSHRDLQVAARRIRLDQLSERQRTRIQLLHGALTYTDDRLKGYDAAVLMEVIEHVDPGRLPALERAVFGHAAPRHVVVTTPNAEYNDLYEGLAAGRFRHRDHRFEWTRSELETWSDAVCTTYGYVVRHVPVGPADADRGASTQMAVFSKR